MTTDMFVRSACGSGFDVHLSGGITQVTDKDGIFIAEVNERGRGWYRIDTTMLPADAAARIAETVTTYALTPISDR